MAMKSSLSCESFGGAMRLDPDMINPWITAEVWQQLADNGRHWLDAQDPQTWINIAKIDSISNVELGLGSICVNSFVENGKDWICQNIFIDKTNGSVIQHLNAGTSIVWIKGNMNQPQPCVSVRDKGFVLIRSSLTCAYNRHSLAI